MNRINFKERIYIDIILLIILILLPWWVGSLVAIILLFLIDNYIEILFTGLLIDSWYSIPSREILGVGQGVLLAATLLIIISVFKQRLIFYTR